MNRREHWEAVYRSRRPAEVSWYQAEAALSARLIGAMTPERESAIIDVGGGASVLAGTLARIGYTNLTVLDISAAALAAARSELAGGAGAIQWIEADVLTAELPAAGFAFWHDRAVFHFLDSAADRSAYVALAARAVAPGGHLLVATFAEDGPSRCSGLDVIRYAPDALHAEFEPAFMAVEAHREAHRTPAGVTQSFTYCVCQRRG